MRGTLLFLAAASLAALLPGCNSLEPYKRAYTWHPIGANESNLATMVADPTDLARGRGTNAMDGQIAAAAVDRLRHDRVKPLSGINGAEPSAAAGPAAN